VERGVVDRVGASVYDVPEVQRALGQSTTAAVQVTLNLLDDRFVRAGILDQCADRGITVYARSVLLQGVLTMKPETLPAHLSPLQPALRRLHALLEDYGREPLDVALPYVLSHEHVDFAVIGVDDAAQLDDNLSRAARPIPEGIVDALSSEFAGLSPQVLEPRRWPTPERTGESP
jgi:aryl-alcohol dehydrogenase-like predicted oxidoreductase